MVRLSLALSLLLTSVSSPAIVESFHHNINLATSSSSISSFSQQNERHHSKQRQKSNYYPSKRKSTLIVRPVASTSPSSSSDFGNDNIHTSNQVGEAISSVTNAALDFVVGQPDLETDQVVKKQRLIHDRKQKTTYKVTLPLAKSTTQIPASKNKILSLGISLCQVSKGRKIDSDIQLNLDTLEFENSMLENEKEDDDDDDNRAKGISFMNIGSTQRRIDGEFVGLVVSSVQHGSAGWLAGVRPGDILRTTSATLGQQLWPKSTLEGVRSALSSRKAVAESIQFEFQRIGETIDNQFELTLTRPIGLELRETPDGYVEVTGFTDKASTLVRYAVKIGDRVLAVDSSLGERMWPVSTVEGVISAVTSRLPGKQITFRFERNPENIVEDSTIITMKRRADTSVSASSVADPPVASVSAVPTSPATSNEELLERCREVMRRYANDEKYMHKFAFPGMVADKVVNALASAETTVDAVTLSMIQSAYLSCRQPHKAIQLFESATGLRGDGSNGKADPIAVDATHDENPFAGTDGKQISPYLGALDVYTVSAILKAHALKDDFSSIKRVLAALEGRGGALVDGIEVASWPGTGPEGNLQPNNRCYNIVMSAAADSKTSDGLKLALGIFNILSNPSKAKSKDSIQTNSNALEKDAVSYNTIIKALTNNGQYQEAIEVFYDMKKSGVKPDKYSYTSLVKAVVVQNDVEEFLYDMREEGVKPDAMLFNSIIRSLCEDKKLAEAKKVVNTMEEMGVAPDSWTYGYLMTALLDGGNPSAALTLFETARSDRKTVGLTENVYLYTNAMTAAAKIGDYKRALELLSRMKVLGIKPNLRTMTTLVGACLAADKPEIAIDVFNRIPNPDAFAVSQGLIALAQAGREEEVLTMLSDKKTIAGQFQGKRLMEVYKVLFQASIAANNYDLARRVLENLIYTRGNIPSKSIFRTIFEQMGLTPTKGLVSRISFSKDGLVKRDGVDDEDSDKFKFLLFMLDIITRRKIPCESQLYTTILSYGIHLSGLPKKIASLMVSARAASGLYSDKTKLIDDDNENCVTNNCLVGGWEDLFVSYDKIRTQIEGPTSLPILQVRVSKREVPAVLRAEKSLSYRKRREV